MKKYEAIAKAMAPAMKDLEERSIQRGVELRKLLHAAKDKRLIKKNNERSSPPG